MQVLVKSLRGTETTRIRQTQIYIAGRIKTHIGTRTKYRMVYQIMLVHPCTDQETPFLILPFVLQENATDMYSLLDRAVIA